MFLSPTRVADAHRPAFGSIRKHNVWLVAVAPRPASAPRLGIAPPYLPLRAGSPGLRVGFVCFPDARNPAAQNNQGSRFENGSEKPLNLSIDLAGSKTLEKRYYADPYGCNSLDNKAFITYPHLSKSLCVTKV